MTKFGIIAGVLAAAVALSACTKPGERTLFGGKYYPAKSKKDGDDRHDFVVTVRRVKQGIVGARAAAEHEGIRYCVETYGDSDITWKPGSDPTETAVTVEGDTLTVRGRCVEW